MRLGVRGKLFTVSLLLILFVGLGSGLYLERSLKGWLEARIEVELFRDANAARTLFELLNPQATVAAIDPLADRLGEATGARVTIISADGRVLGDSELEPQQIAHVENHRARPEVKGALKGYRGISRRYSTTVQTEMLYAAVPYMGSGAQGIVRIALPLSEVDEAIRRLRLVLFVAGIVGLVLAIFLSGLASEFATRDIRALVKSARGAVKGEGTRLVSIGFKDELARLAGSFNSVLADLNRTVSVLANERDHLETILESMSEGVLALDSTRHIIRVNGAARTCLDIGAVVPEAAFIETIRIPALADLISDDAVKRHAQAEFELSGPRYVQAQVAPLRTGGCVVVLHDITHTRRLETIRKDFVANVSHELRTPVSVIRANSETLAHAAAHDPEQMRVFLDAICRNADRLSRIIADLLDLSRIEAGEYHLDLEAVELSAVVRSVLQSIRAPMAQVQASIDIDIPTGTLVCADTHGLEQVLLNLLNNAVKYSGEAGSVKIRALQLRDQDSTVFGNGSCKTSDVFRRGPEASNDPSTPNASVRIEIVDDGPGIERHHRARVFERFYRVDPGRSRELGGTGLGLSIVKHLVESMGGQVGFEPHEPQGSIFWFTLVAPE